MTDDLHPDEAALPARMLAAIELGDDRAAWEKQKGESRQAFANFALYRDLGPRRSIVKAAGEAGRNKATLEAQSRKYMWVARAEAYDDMMDKRYRDEREGELMRAERREAQLGQAMQTLGARRILGSPATEDQPAVPGINPASLEPLEAARFVEQGIRIRRLAQGQPTDVLKGQFQISSADLIAAAQGVYEILMQFVPEDRQSRAASQVAYFIETGRKA